MFNAPVVYVEGVTELISMVNARVVYVLSAYAGQLFPKSIFEIIQCGHLHNDTCTMCEIWNHMGWT